MYCSNCASVLRHRPPVTCTNCGLTHYANAKPCGGALAADDQGRLLLVRRAHEPWLGYWDIPGGFCGERELPADAAVRELREETGLEAEATALVGTWLDDYGDTGHVCLNLYYEVRITGGREAPDPAEVSELGWFAPDALPPDEELAFPEHERSVLDAWAERRPPSGR